MNDLTLQGTVMQLVKSPNEFTLEKAEELLLDYLKKTPEDIDAWARVVILETLTPLGDYARAVLLLELALSNHHDNPIFTILLSFFSEWFLGGMSENQLGNLLELKKKSDSSTNAIILYLLAWHYKSIDSKRFIELLNESISICNHHVKNFVDLGQHYLQQGKTKIGKQLVEQGLANVKLVYKEDEIDKNYDALDVTRFINERITGIFITEGTYHSIAQLL
ncbi:hypothetical protein B4V02_00860 [Paenibacillus kribbensis]|uniref:Tetratricopeptide repeat protein n=1 Tax=Paenibacillus kribbensis TaxID=172713 RepID=A0A222WG79_9BACL|nr:hypothetical protein [Paenibacillus kribbensis]ASR45359.1 hypothetical protein B4V02_00860 [Paenibacillus kribbensis]